MEEIASFKITILDNPVYTGVLVASRSSLLQKLARTKLPEVFSSLGTALPEKVKDDSSYLLFV